MRLKQLYVFSAFLFSNVCLATNYYIHPVIGDDNNSGTNIMHPLKTLEKAGSLKLYPGDAIKLAAGYTFEGMLKLEGIRGAADKPIVIDSYQWANAHQPAKAIIDSSHGSHGIYLLDCSYIHVENIIITAGNADGKTTEDLTETQASVKPEILVYEVLI